MADPMLFQFIGDSVDKALDAFVNGVAGTTVTAIVATAVAMATLYYVLMGYQMIAGRVQQPFSALGISAVKFILISAFALHADNYLTWVVGGLESLEKGLAAAWSGSEVEPSSVYAVVDGALGKGWTIAGDLWEQAANRSWDEIGMALGEYFNAVLIALATLVIALPAGAMIITAKAALALLFGIGPFFIMCLMFPITAKWFDSWLGQVLSNIFSIALLAAVLTFEVKIFSVFVGAVDLNGDQNPLFTSLQILALSITLLWLLYRANNMGAALAGGISASAITFGQMAGAALAPGKAVSNQLRHNRSEADRKRQLAHYDKADKGGKGGGSVENRSGAGAAYRSGLAGMMQRQQPKVGIGGDR